MGVPVNAGTWLAAALPVIVLLLLMVYFQMGAVKAAFIGVIIAAAASLGIFRAGWGLLLNESLKGIWSAASIIFAVWPALLLYEFVREAEAFSVFKVSIRRYCPNELMQILFIARVFVSFLQGIAGFGVPVAVGAPLLVSIGVAPVWAVLFCLMGQAWGNTFGTLALAWDALVLQAGIGEDPVMLAQTALWGSFFIWFWNFVTGVGICWGYGRMEGVKKGLPAVLLLSMIQGGGEMVMSVVNPTLACFVPCCAAVAAGLLLGKSRWYGKPWRVEDSPVMERREEALKSGTANITGENTSTIKMTLHQAALPYYVLTAVTLLVLLLPPVKQVLGRWSFSFSFPASVTGYGYRVEAVDSYSPLAPLTHAGFFLFVSAVFSYVYFHKKGWLCASGGKAALFRSVKKTIPSGTAVICFLVMSKMMSGSAQTQVLADGMAKVCGRGFAALSPLVGMLGSFMTSSNMSSNILFTEFQMTTAKLLQINVSAILGAQTAGGAIGAAICPGNIVLGAVTAGISGQEGEILKKILPLSVGTALFVGIILLVTVVVM